ncbi:MAG TPA: chemotaxis protein CheW [Blastocatellia bacterium]|nr:chemotaxis protein CheW [Blastocatellia bacterium]
MAVKRQLVLFRIGREEFGVDIIDTKEVLSMREVTPVPETLEFVEGVMNLRGNLVPILDLRKRLRAGASDAHKDRRIIIVNFNGRMTGLVVDGASEVLRIGDEMVLDPPALIFEAGVDYISGIVRLEERIVSIIDLKKALTGQIGMELEEVTRLITGGHVGSGQPAQAV